MSIIKLLIKTFIKNEYSKNIQDDIHYWLLDSSFENEKDDALFDIWRNMDIKADYSTLESLKKVEDRISINKDQKSKKRILLSQFARIAAIILLPILSIIGIRLYLDNGKPKLEHRSNELVEYFVLKGETCIITLPDSSQVTINSGSILIYPQHFDEHERYVYLNGEAYFDIVKDQSKPFIVKTNDLQVEVLGTKFNVSAYSDDLNITTSLEEGEVQLNFNNKNLSSLKLQPNDQIIYNRISNDISKRQLKQENIAGWRKGDLIFHRATINDIIRNFEYRYDITVFLNSNSYEKDILTVKFIHGESLEESLDILRQIIPKFQYKIKDKKVFIH